MASKTFKADWLWQERQLKTKKKTQNATAHISTTMCSHRKQILGWDSSWPNITIISTWWLWQSWLRFGSLTWSCMGHKLSKSLRHWGKTLWRVFVKMHLWENWWYLPGSIQHSDVFLIIAATDAVLSVCAYCSCSKHMSTYGVSGLYCVTINYIQLLLWFDSHFFFCFKWLRYFDL